MFYVYQIDDNHFLTISKGMTLGKTKNIEKAAYWGRKKDVNTWDKYIKNKFPNAKLREATLKLKD